MSTALRFARRRIPARIAELGFSAELPADWIAHELPEQALDFANPAFLVPLAVVAAPHAALVFTFAARPAYEDGSVHDWAWYLLRENGLQPSALGTGALGSLPAIVGETEQESELGRMQIYFAFAEDGERLLNVSITAPSLFADIAAKAWFAALSSFELETPRGPTAVLMPPAQPAAATSVEPEVDEEEHVAAPEPERRGGAKSRLKAARKSAVRAAERPKLAGAERLNRAMELEASGQLDEAERVLGRDDPDPGTAYRIAELYRSRMQRLLADGERAAAREAFRQADRWIHFHAAQATSGGEGVALSAERDQFREQLVREYGGEPG